MSKEKVEKFKVIDGDEDDIYTPDFVVSSGSYLLDQNLVRGGFPSGSMIHFFSSKEGSFKTATALLGLANIQKLTGKPVGFVDAEQSLDIKWARDIGVDTGKGKWKYVLPDSGEEAFEAVERLITEHDCKGVVLDSISAAQPSIIDDNEYGDNIIGQHAKLVSKAASRINKIARKHQAIVYIVNQSRENLTSMGARGEKAQGGRMLMFLSKINIEMKRGANSELKKLEDVVPITMFVQRSKMGRSFYQVDTFARQGFSLESDMELIDLALSKGIIIKKGSWFRTPDGEAICQGKFSDEIFTFVIENKELILK